MKTFKEFIEQTVPPKSNINIVPGSGDIHRSRNDRRAFGFGRRNKVSDFSHLRYGQPWNGKPAQNTTQGAPAFNPPPTPSTRLRQLNRKRSQSSGLM